MTTVDEKRFRALEELIKKEIPGFKIDYKDTTKDWKIRAVAKIVGFFNKTFMTGFTTTLYPAIYFVSKKKLQKDYGRYFYTLCHEFVHLWDRRTKGFWFTLSYLSPQILVLLSLFSLFSFFSLWFLLFLLFLPCAAPVRSLFRTKWEMRGYTMNMVVRVWDEVPITETYMNQIVENFTGMNYYRMCPDGDYVRYKLLEAQGLANTTFFLEGEDSYPYRRVKTIMEEIPRS
ncbi:MAG: hypothetical protein GF334_04520 [Candidatus Altiarchaeales archaeon]|nr:hypothetical protein [Candidatus Altiarchaeales archaeon]